MQSLMKRLRRALAAALVLTAPAGAVVVESVRVEAPTAPLAVPAVLSASAFSAAPSLPAILAAPSISASPSAAPAAAPVPFTSPWANAQAVAERLGQSRGVPAAGHEYFYEMLARYLYNGNDDATLSALADHDAPFAILPADYRWAGKLARDLAEPYDDAQALARLDHLQTELTDCARWLKERAPRGGYRLALMGGLLRGRLSAHSDVDLMLYTDDADLLRDAMNGPFGYLTKGRDAVLGPVPKNPRLLAAMGETVDLGDGSAVLDDPALVRRVFFRARAALASAPMERDARLDAELMGRIKRLGVALDHARDDAERLSVERDIDALAEGLPPPADPLGARRASSLRVGTAIVDLRAPGAANILATLGRADSRPVIGLYEPKTGRVINSFPLGAYGVREHRDAVPPGMDARDYTGWTAQLSPDGRLRFATSGGVFGPLTPRLRRAVARHLGVRPAVESLPGRWVRRLLAALDLLRSR
jgi:hypothetical protein